MRWQLGVNGAPVPHSPLDSHTSPGFAASQFHTTSRLVGDGHLSGGTSRRQMPQDNPASQVPHAGAEGGGAVASLKARAFAMRQEVMRRAAVGDIAGRSGRADGGAPRRRARYAQTCPPLTSGRPRQICGGRDGVE